MKERTDREILRHSVAQVLQLDLTQEHGWKEGTGYWSGPPKYQPDITVGENLVQRGILIRDGSRLYLTEATLMRIMHCAMDAVLDDLLAHDPVPASLPEIPDYYDNGPERLIFTGLHHDEIEVRG